jgi:hypothetical protein
MIQLPLQGADTAHWSGPLCAQATVAVMDWGPPSERKPGPPHGRAGRNLCGG